MMPPTPPGGARRHKRSRVLIRPRLQLSSAFFFACCAAICVLFFAALGYSSITRLESLGVSSDVLGTLADELQQNLLFALAFTVPFCAAAGVFLTFRVAGPLYRFEVYLKQVIRGERPPDCRIRSYDELHDLCGLINKATAPLRSPLEEPTAEETQDEDEPEPEVVPEPEPIRQAV